MKKRRHERNGKTQEKLFSNNAAYLRWKETDEGKQARVTDVRSDNAGSGTTDDVVGRKDAAQKMLFEVGDYTVKEDPTGGWSVKVTKSGEVLSRHENRAEAKAAAEQRQK